MPGSDPTSSDYLAQATSPGDGLKVVIHLTKEAEKALTMVLSLFHRPHCLNLTTFPFSLLYLTLGSQVSSLAAIYHQQREELGQNVSLADGQQSETRGQYRRRLER